MNTNLLQNMAFIVLSMFLGTAVYAQGYTVTSDLWINAEIQTAEKGKVNAVWKKGGDTQTQRGDRVIWGHFYANPSDVSWGSEENPDLFVKIWFDVSGRIDVNYFHVSVPNIYVSSRKGNNKTLLDTTTLSTRYVRQYFEANGTQNSVAETTPETLRRGTFHFLSDNTFPLPMPSAEINTAEKGLIGAKKRVIGSGFTARGDFVYWGYLYADSAQVSWGSEGNPEVFFKVWYDKPAVRYDTNFFHVSVPDVNISSVISFMDLDSMEIKSVDANSQLTGTVTLTKRYARFEYLQTTATK